MSDNKYRKIVLLREACKGLLYCSLSGFLAALVLPVIFLAALKNGVGLWFSISSWVGAYIGFRVGIRGAWNPLTLSTWGFLPYGRHLADKEFSKKAESYGAKVYSETNLLPVRISLLLMPAAFVLLSLNSVALNVYVFASIFGGLLYSLVVVNLISLPVLIKAKSRHRISLFFKIPEPRLIKLEKPKISRPQSVIYLSIPFVAVGIIGILSGVLLMIGGIFQIQSLTQLFPKYNPIAYGLMLVFLGLFIFWIGRRLLQMSMEWALIAGVSAVGFMFISLLALVGGFLRSFLAPSISPLLSPFLAATLSLGLLISIQILWLLKKNWNKFDKEGVRYYTTIYNVSETKNPKRKK